MAGKAFTPVRFQHASWALTLDQLCLCCARVHIETAETPCKSRLIPCGTAVARLRKLGCVLGELICPVPKNHTCGSERTPPPQMRILRARIQGFRSIGDLSVEFHDLTAMVGSGGVGKSTILNALGWFFHGGDLAERDLHRPNNGEPASNVLVMVEFDQLNEADREILGRYVEGETTTLTRSWSLDEGEKLSGNALVFPDFEHVRTGEGALEIRRRYKDLHDSKGGELGLPDPPTSRERVEAAMETWERENPEKCETKTADARHLGGFTGTPLLESRFEYVLVGATAGAPEALSGTRGTALDRLLSVVEELDAAARDRITELQEGAQEEIQRVVADARARDLLSLGANLTERVAVYFPGAAVRLEDEIAPPRPPQISVRALVSDRGGHPMDPELQGHGLQRALVIALLHELAEVATAEGEEEEGPSPRALMLAIEEPELYQHPLQARALADSLDGLASRDNGPPIQVAYSTHSPYFTRPALFSDLRLCRRDADGGTRCVAADRSAVERAIDDAGYTRDVARRVEASLANSLREAIFARTVLLCEGPTDAAVIAGVAQGQGGLDREGIAIAECESKSGIGVAIAILTQLELPFFVLFDADADKQNPDEATHNRRILALCGEQEVDWPDREVREKSANFADTLETDLEDLWPQFAAAQDTVATELAMKNEKNPRLYREAAARAGEPPGFLVDVIEAVREAG